VMSFISAPQSDHELHGTLQRALLSKHGPSKRRFPMKHMG
jgi:hypothetical protein